MPPNKAQGVEGAWIGRGTKRCLSFVPTYILHGASRMEDLRVGVILDEFSAVAFSHEWTSIALDPAVGHEQLEGLDMIFIESAWAGNTGRWTGKITGSHGPSQELMAIVAAAKLRDIPTVFWNKEDPPHYEDFLPAARLFDYVFTSDIGRIESYQKDLGHSQIALLPFAAQPAVHNPIRPQKGWHQRDVAFAGMYFAHKYPERRQQMEQLLGGAYEASQKMKLGLEIFSRQLGGKPEYQFPKPFDSRVVGSLTYPQMLSAYKAYKVFLNVNSVVNSESMCARRIFEISASGTPVISTPSAAIRRFFSVDEVPIAENRSEASNLTLALVRNKELNDRTAHLAQRRIWQEHTYSHRVATVLHLVLPDRSLPSELPTVSAMVPTIRPDQVEHVFQTLASQRGVQVQLVLLTHGFELEKKELIRLREEYKLADVVLLTANRDVSLGECLNRCVAASSSRVLAKIDDDDHYGEHYLSDQLFALEYSRADIVGKQSHYMHLKSSNATILRFEQKEHMFTNFVMGPTIVGYRHVFNTVPFPELDSGEDTGFLRAAIGGGLKIYSADRFNFCQVRKASGHTWKIRDMEILATSDVKFYGNALEHVSI